MKTNDLFKPGANCWQVSHCERAAFIIDGERYFKALYQSIPKAQHSFFILSWDIVSQLDLIRTGTKRRSSKVPSKLGPMLDHTVCKNDQLQGYVLNWDYSLLLATDRELLPSVKFDWSTDSSLHFEQDDNIPLGGCHHQKLVVIDDQLAYCGGIDITRGRWDTREHIVDDARRQLANSSYPQPHHDIQMAVAGEVAGALGELARQRWEDACQRSAKPAEENKPRAQKLWPRSLKVDVKDVSVAISRTVPDESLEGQYEVEQLYLDVINHAEDYLYLENQYLTSESIAEALEMCLLKPDGPEVIIVTPLCTDGWVSRQTMDQRRAELVERLTNKDKFNRLLVLYPRITRDDETVLNVHSKLTIADNQFIRIGSANLSNRSMRLDSECDLSIFEKDRPDVSTAIERFRNKLIAEHLGLPFRKVARHLNSASSLKAGVEQLCRSNEKKNKTRSLLPIPLKSYKESSPLSEFSDLFDPTEPIEPKLLLNYLSKVNQTPEEELVTRDGLPWAWIVTGCLCLLMAALWKWGPLQDWTDLSMVQNSLQWLKETPLASVIAVAGITVATLSMVPITFVAGGAAILFGLLHGFAIVLAAAMLSAFIAYQFGNWMGRDSLKSIAGQRFDQVSKKLAQHGVLSVAAIRLLPVAPFTVVNLVAGASHISLKDFMLGSLVAMGPGLFIIMLLVDQVSAGISSNNLVQIALSSVGVIAVIAIAYFLFGSKLKRWSASQRSNEQTQ